MSSSNKDFIRNKYSNLQKKPSKPKSKKIAMIVLWTLFVFWTIASVLSVFSFAKTVKADTVTELYTFEGSNITVWGRTIQFYHINSYNDYIGVSGTSDLKNPKVHPYLNSTNCLVNYRFKLSDVRYDTDSGESFLTEMVVNTAYIQYDSAPMIANAYGDSYNAEAISDGNTRIVLGTESLISYYYIYSRQGPGQFVKITRSSSDFICNITRVDMGTYEGVIEPACYFGVEDGVQTNDIFTSGGVTSVLNFIRYYDINDNYLEIAVPVTASKSYQPQAYFTPRSYLLTSNISDSSIYKIALQEGYNNGFEEGRQTGYSSGYIAGQSSGYTDGYQDGLVASANYTWLGLMGSVIDAPIRALFGSRDAYGSYRSGLLSFEILGVNLSNFISGMLTVSLVILVIRKVMGK